MRRPLGLRLGLPARRGHTSASAAGGGGAASALLYVAGQTPAEDDDGLSVSTSPTTMLAAYTPPEGAGCLLVVIGIDGSLSSRDIDAVTFGGVAMTEIDIKTGDAGTDHQLFYLNSPGGSAGDIVGTAAGGAIYAAPIAFCLDGPIDSAGTKVTAVDQSSPYAATVAAANGDFVLSVASVDNDASTVTVASGGTEIAVARSTTNGGRHACGYIEADSAGDKTINWTLGNAANEVSIIALKP